MGDIVIVGWIVEVEKTGDGAKKRVASLDTSQPKFWCQSRKMHEFAPALRGIDAEHVFRYFHQSIGLLMKFLLQS
jgi:hypothetical protein